MASPAVIQSKRTIFLNKPPCCLDFFPDSTEYECFVVGTYNLLQSEAASADQEEENGSKSQMQRDGSLVIFQIIPDDLIQVESIEVPYGVLDIHFQPSTDGSGSILGVATSTGSFALFRSFNLDRPSGPSLRHILTVQHTSLDTVITSFAWDPRRRGQVAATLSTGDVDSIDFDIPAHDPESGLQPTEPVLVDRQQLDSNSVYKHSLEAWTVAFSPRSWNQQHHNWRFSGGDDAVFRTEALPVPSQSPTVQNAVWTDKRTHNAGVTAIFPIPYLLATPLSNTDSAPDQEGTTGLALVLTGSYDDQLRVWVIPDTKSGVEARRPARMVHEVDLGGGVWRITPLSVEFPTPVVDRPPKTQTRQTAVGTACVLVSAMYAGAFVVQLTFQYPTSGGVGPGGENLKSTSDEELVVTSEIVAQFTEHESMCYACAAAPMHHPSIRSASPEPRSRLEQEPTTRKIVSCSFYDKRVCLWEGWSGSHPKAPQEKDAPYMTK